MIFSFLPVDPSLKLFSYKPPNRRLRRSPLSSLPISYPVSRSSVNWTRTPRRSPVLPCSQSAVTTTHSSVATKRGLFSCREAAIVRRVPGMCSLGTCVVVWRVIQTLSWRWLLIIADMAVPLALWMELSGEFIYFSVLKKKNWVRWRREWKGVEESKAISKQPTQKVCKVLANSNQAVPGRSR